MSVVEGPPGVAVVTPPIRWLSWAIDVGVVIVAAALVSLVSDMLGLLVGIVGGPAYYVLAEQRGGTLGHRATRVRVIDTETGLPAPLTSLGIRLAVVFGLVLPLAIPFVANAVLMVARPGWVSVHDLCARSEVRR